eukprot:1184182-Prorocentrum_minimum.AAC.1
MNTIVTQCTPVPRAGLGLAQGTSMLHTELAPGNPGFHNVGYEAYGRLDLTDESPPTPLRPLSDPSPTPLRLPSDPPPTPGACSWEFWMFTTL